MNPEARNKTVIQQLVEASERNDLAEQATFFAGPVAHHPIRIDRDSIRAVSQDISTTFTDVKLAPVKILAEKDGIVACCVLNLRPVTPLETN